MRHSRIGGSLSLLACAALLIAAEVTGKFEPFGLVLLLVGSIHAWLAFTGKLDSLDD